MDLVCFYFVLLLCRPNKYTFRLMIVFFLKKIWVKRFFIFAVESGRLVFLWMFEEENYRAMKKTSISPFSVVNYPSNSCRWHGFKKRFFTKLCVYVFMQYEKISTYSLRGTAQLTNRDDDGDGTRRTNREKTRKKSPVEDSSKTI